MPRLVFLVLCAAVLLVEARATKPAETFRLGLSYGMMSEVNENDVKAALHGIFAVISREHRMHADPETLLFRGVAALGSALQAQEVDAVVLTTDEYWAMKNEAAFVRYIAPVEQGVPTETYLLLVRRDSGIAGPGDLRGKQLAVHANPRMRLGYLWLEVVLARNDGPPLATFFSRTTKTGKLSKVVLDVFFKRADACLVTQRAFETMAEMNPQVGKQLVPLAVSPPAVPTFVAFRADLPPEYIEKIMSKLASVLASEAGKQAMTIFQTGDLREFPLSILDSGLALLEEYQTLRPVEAATLVLGLQQSALGPIGRPTP